LYFNKITGYWCCTVFIEVYLNKQILLKKGVK
jgi:hypothetical protein